MRWRGRSRVPRQFTSTSVILLSPSLGEGVRLRDKVNVRHLKPLETLADFVGSRISAWLGWHKLKIRRNQNRDLHLKESDVPVFVMGDDIATVGGE